MTVLSTTATDNPTASMIVEVAETQEDEAGDGTTLFLRGSTDHVVDELERGVGDALDVVVSTVAGGKVLAGGGAVEVELASRVRDYADSVDGREQLAVEAFADSLEVVPRVLAENAGLDAIDALVDLRTAHEAGDEHAGLDVYSGEVVDTFEAGVVEPAGAKRQALDSATEAATLVLRSTTSSRPTNSRHRPARRTRAALPAVWVVYLAAVWRNGRRDVGRDEERVDFTGL